MLELRDVSVRRGDRTILNRVSFSVERGALVALMGPSGSGKTTILRTIAGLDAFDAGTIVVDGLTLQPGIAEGGGRARLRHLSKKVGLVFQFHCLFEHLPALQNVWLSPVHVHRTAQPDAERQALELLKALGVEHRARALPRELSGGEAQRVAIARALATDPPVLLMDEPTASLDPARRTELSALLRSLVSRQRTLVIATHDEDFAHAVATSVMYVREGRIVV